MDPSQDHSRESESQPPIVTGWKKLVFAVAAGFFFLLGLLGVFVPALPTTPFLLLTSYFLVRCSPKLNTALLNSRLIGPILTDWQVRGGVRSDIKIKAIATVVIAVSISVYFARNSMPIVGTTLTIAAIGIYVIIRLPALKR